MFTGEYSSQIGDKNRIAIPKKIREKCEGKVFITRGFDRTLLLIDSARWEVLLKNINRGALLNEKVRELKRFFLSGMQEVEPDAQGRFVLNEAYKSFANLETEAIFIGTGEWVEIWNSNRWKTKLENLSGEITSIGDALT